LAPLLNSLCVDIEGIRNIFAAKNRLNYQGPKLIFTE